MMVRKMAQQNGAAPWQHIGNTVLVVTMEVDEADEAEFNEPAGLAIVGNRIFVADTNNHLIRVINTNSGEVSTLELKGL